MALAYYNEHDPFAAAWLRSLIEIPSGGIGTGLANLKGNAPAIFWYINENLRALEGIVC